jgi:hypothetical protein
MNIINDVNPIIRLKTKKILNSGIVSKNKNKWRAFLRFEKQLYYSKTVDSKENAIYELNIIKKSILKNLKY